MEMGLPLFSNAYCKTLSNQQQYDVAIIGGGLAGLALSIQLAKANHHVILFEKENYPFHKVCGEYISLESWDFLCSLGIDLNKMNLPVLKRLQVSSPNGKCITHPLPLGGFGISRFTLDHLLMKLAVAAGVTVKENTKVDDILFEEERFIISAEKTTFTATVACGSFGKRSNIDVKWKRPFVAAAKNKLNNYVGIKYHVKYDLAPDIIALHNFNNGYCGIVKIEEDKYCLCYLTTAANLQKCNGSIKEMEVAVLSQNPQLKKIFAESEILYDTPLVISQISFDKKQQVKHHVLMIGDAAGMITPLCGNGMSMALHGSKIAFGQIDLFLHKKITREMMELQYTLEWKKNFSKRLRTGRFIQKMFGSSRVTNAFVAVLKPFPGLINRLIKQTHGNKF
jgi:flavin-dependent dehydrogenase